VEVAPGRRADRARDVALQQDALALDLGVGDRHRGEQRLGVGVARVRVEVLRGRDLDDLAEVHHGDARADVLDDRQVVGDEQVREVELLLEVLEEVDHLRLDRHVQRGDGLVADDELGADGEGPCDADALPLPARELVRVAPHVIRVETHRLEEVGDLLLALTPALGELVDDERLADDGAHGHPRVQRRVGVLEDDLEVAPERAERPLVHGRDVLALEPDLAGRRLDEPQDAAARRRLPASRLAHEPERLAGVDLEGHPVDGVDPRDLP
jgi:hypothetical protein